ncbi:MAG TPA: carbamoyl-phosphate synthase large subunit, partial [Hyphomicrobium sp.]|nr:carbamoyl-phosphate synthase large subunit [Hyphomicrobium sp.]
RKLFREAMDRIGLESPRAAIASSPPIRDEQGHIVRYDTAAGFAEAMRLLETIGLPAIIRPAFTLGGTGGGVAYNREEFEQIARSGIDASPVGQILIDESLLGWKEYEMEVVRDKADNCIIICSIENVDPMGVHTGDSITVAPALTLTDKEYQLMRNASIAVLREIGVETGGSNVQFAVNPDDGRLVVIEMNPRVSRSSALASKATGFPIAKVAAKLAVGYTLDELANDITEGATPASFEPTIDYVVTKIPRFAFEKFPGSDATLTTAMKSVGEVMAIGRTFAESVQKALRSMETGLSGFDDIALEGLGVGDDKNVIRAAVSKPTPDRLLKVAQAIRLGFSVEQVFESCRIDPWFLNQIKEIIDQEERVKAHGLPKSAGQLRSLKAMGFSDARLAALAGMSEKDVRAHRASLDVHPVFKRIDTCAAEFAAPTAYMYSTYERGLVLSEIKAIIDTEARVIAHGLPKTKTQFRALKAQGFSDARLSKLARMSEADVRQARQALDVTPVFKRIDTCAAEFASPTAYMYSTYESGLSGEPVCEATPTDKEKIIILGGGPNRIGQGIEFDYCCCHACFSLTAAGFETIMVNCNPETVSTDYDTSDRLFFEPL